MNNSVNTALLGIVAVLVVACLYMHTKAQDALSRVESLERVCSSLQQSMDSLLKISEVTKNQMLEWKVSLDNVDSNITETKRAAKQSLAASKTAGSWASVPVPADVMRVLAKGSNAGAAPGAAAGLP